MFSIYLAIIFVVLLTGGAGVTFQAFSIDNFSANSPIPVKPSESKFA